MTDKFRGEYRDKQFEILHVRLFLCLRKYVRAFLLIMTVLSGPVSDREYVEIIMTVLGQCQGGKGSLISGIHWRTFK